MKLPAGLSESDVVKRVTVRLVMDQERAEFDRLLEEKHYVHESRLTGETLRYILELDGQWVALAAFSAASLHLKARERWIGWSPRQRARRLCMVVNNSRFLVLPERECYPNLASRGLGLCLRRLSQDWQERWGHPVWVVETFVDETRYRGTCYRACGFEAVGPTAGFARASRDYYDYHGEPKQLYLRELQPGARKPLRQARWPEALAEYEASRIETNHFASIIGSWLLEQEIAVLARLAVDGKVLRGSGRSDGKPLQLLSAVTHQLRLTLGQVPIEEIGLCGCWQVIAVERLSIDLTKLKDPPSLTVGYYTSSLAVEQYNKDDIGDIIRGHWSAIENGTHYRRDVTLGEDANRTHHRQGAEALTTLRNLVNGIYELEIARNRTNTTATLPEAGLRRTDGTKME